MMHAIQAGCVAIGTRGVLILGPPGSGKSSLALALIDRGAKLVGDDSLLVGDRNGSLVACPHPRTRGLIEVRNLGLVSLPVCDEAPVALAIRLDRDAPRFPQQPETATFLGFDVPLVRLVPDSPVQHLKVELALQRLA
ncbi:MAG: HPr kinase/phosphatase C-terminal domain-containing protein [Novosphingobium sp.]